MAVMRPEEMNGACGAPLELSSRTTEVVRVRVPPAEAERSG